MKLVQETKQTPTYKQYADSEEYSEGSIHPVELVLVKDEWKSITFFTDAFKLSFKFKTNEEYSKQVKAISKLLSKPCKCYLEAESKAIGNLHLNSASDADEEYQQYDSTERGWNRTR
jgi:hypothetical protein